MTRRGPPAPPGRSDAASRPLPPSIPTLLAGIAIAVLAAACGGDDGTGSRRYFPADMEVAGGLGQRDTVGARLGEPIAFRVVELDGTPVPRADVLFVVLVGGGSVDPEVVETGPDGVAATRWTLGPEPGEQRIRAVVPAVTFHEMAAEATPGRPATLEPGVPGVTLPRGGATELEPVVRDRLGNVIPDAGVAWSSSRPEVVTVDGRRLVGAAEGTATVTAAAGDARRELGATVVPSLESRGLLFGTPGSITLARGDGTDRRLLPALRNPAWAPDGSAVAGNGPGDGVPEPVVYVVDAGSGAVRRPAAAPARQRSPAWAPDGSAIAFAGERMADSGALLAAVYVVPAAGGPAEPITPEVEEPLDVAAWSSTGERILYTRGGEVHAVASDGASAPERLAGDGGTGLTFVDPVWSPGGDEVAVQVEGLPGPDPVAAGWIPSAGESFLVLGPGVHPAWDPRDAGVAALRPAGSTLQPVLYTPADLGVVPLPKAVGTSKGGPLSWSGDGALLLYGIEVSRGFELAAVSRDGSWSRRLGGLVADAPAWAWRPGMP